MFFHLLFCLYSKCSQYGRSHNTICFSNTDDARSYISDTALFYFLNALFNEKGRGWKEGSWPPANSPVYPARAFTSLSLLPAMEGRAGPGVEGELCGNVTVLFPHPHQTLQFGKVLPLHRSTPFILPLRLCPLSFFSYYFLKLNFITYKEKCHKEIAKQ